MIIQTYSKIGEGKLKKFQAARRAKTKDAKLEFVFGMATTRDMLHSFNAKGGQPIDFVQIGLGKPLTVQIRHIYTGNKAEGFWKDKDMLVASAMKSVATYDAAPRAINFLLPKTRNNRNFRAVDATDKGTPLICYSPALAQSSSVVTVEVMFSGFPKETFDAISRAFSASAGVPIFAPASGYLVAAGIVTKLLGNIGKSLSDGTPALKRLEEITFVTPGSNEAVAHYALLISDAVESTILQDYKVTNKGTLARIDDETKLYDGEHPYVVISLDGRENNEFKNFAPTAASAAQLDKFYNMGDGGSQPLGALVDGLKLYNDMKFRDKAVSVAEKLQKFDKKSKDFQELLTQYNAYIGNIGTKELQPTALP